MPRSPRIEYEDATYHVMAPGKLAAMQPAQFRSAFYLPLIAAWRWRQPIIFSDADRDLFVETPAEACALAKFKTYAKVAPRGF